MTIGGKLRLEPSNLYKNQTHLDKWANTVTTVIYLYYTPLLVSLGVIGNVLCMLVFNRIRRRLQSTSIYLTALAVSDTIFLLQLLPPWLHAAGVSMVFHRHGFCQLFMYASYVSCGASAWLVVIFTLERLVAVRYPLRRLAVCTVARARACTAAVAIVALAFNAPVLWFVKPRDGDCDIDRNYLTAATHFNVIDTALSFTVPLLVIVVVNIVIVMTIRRADAARNPTGRARRPPLDESFTQRRITAMLLNISWMFVACNLPAYAFRIMVYNVVSSCANAPCHI